MRPLLAKFYRFSHASPEVTLVAINFGLLLLWGMSFGLQKVGVPFLSLLIGPLVLLAPGMCLALVLEQLSEVKTKKIIFGLWVVLFSFILTPTATLGLSEFVLKQSPVTSVLLAFSLWWAVCFVIASVVIVLRRQPTVLHDLSLSQSTKKELAYILIAFLVIMAINFMVYPFLPEGDTYLLLVKWENIVVNPSLFAAETRSPFLIFLNLSSHLLNVDPYWILKLFLPLSHVAIVLSLYFFVRKFATDSRSRILLSLAPLFFPIILEESLISRPQSVFLITFIPSMVIASEVLARKIKLPQLYSLFALFVLGVIGIKIHTLFVLVALMGMISVIVFLRKEIKQRPLDALIIGLVLLAIFAPEIIHSRLIPDLRALIQLFATTFRHAHFELWFIDHYHNVDGAEVGWPGLSWLFYYGYNLGLMFPLVFVWFVARRRGRSLEALMKPEFWMIVTFFLFFFFIAEIAPRFQLAYLPDRAWLFLALLFTLVLPVIIEAVRPVSGRRFLPVVTTISLISVLAGTALTYAKQGWVTADEVKAASFIKSQTPPNTIILGPGTTRVMVRYYGKREFSRPKEPAIFLTGEKDVITAYLKDQQSLYQAAFADTARRKALLSTKLSEVAREIIRPEVTDAQFRQYLDSLSIMTQQDYTTDKQLLSDLYPTVGRPVYLTFNEHKFTSLYGGRSWWRSSNFYGTDVARLSANYPLVYDKNGVKIWLIRKETSS